MEREQMDQLERLEDKQAENDILKTIFGEKESEVKLLQQERQNPMASQWELSFYDVIEEVEHILKGETRDESGKWVAPADETYRLMSDRGIHDIKVLLNAVANKNTFLSVMEEERIYYFIRTFRINIVSLIARNSATYHMESRYRDYVVDMLTEIVAAALFRSQDGGEAKRRASTTINRNTYGEITRPQSHEKKGLLGIGFMGL